MICDQIISFYQSLIPPENLPSTVEVLNPYKDNLALKLTTQFYQKYFSDDQPRKVLFGINPGRFGGGITGIPFTDPIVLSEICGIENDLPKRAELSSDFIYQMINAQRGPRIFYQHYFVSAISPLGYVQNGKNLNYYDMPNWKQIFENYVVKLIRKQLTFSLDTSEAFSIGQGANLKFLQYLNEKYSFFKKITPLPHPRWIMQYRRKRKGEFIQTYHEAFKLK